MLFKNICLSIVCLSFAFVTFASKNLLLLNEALIVQTVTDKLNPPQASRVLAYCNFAYYYGFNYNVESSLVNQIAINRGIDLHLAQLQNGDTDNEKLATTLFVYVANQMSYTETNWPAEIYNQLVIPKNDLHFKVITERLDELLKSDDYLSRDNEGFYQLTEGPYSYQLTPPTYAQPIESNWNKVKPFLLSNVQNYQVENRVLNDVTSAKKFKKHNKKILKTSKKTSDTEKNSAMLWDCNPVKTSNIGHVKTQVFRMTPAAHWVGILIDISKQQNQSSQQLANNFTILTLALADAFVVVWENKYASNFIRPVTYINKHLDDGWNPILETPLFPEFPSGHSTVSMVAADLLSNLYGANYTFTDSTQFQYCGINKMFNSFNEAAKDAGYSRYYGGIHYLEAIEAGFYQGHLISTAIWNLLNVK